MIKIYTDGSYKSSTDQGGYGVVITVNDKVHKILHYGYKNTTNNRMELMAVIAALEYFKKPSELKIYSDSNYIVNCINGNYIYNWFDDGSKQNMDLWKKIINLIKFHKVKFFWVKGHSNNEYNNLADLYANMASIVLNPIKDEKV